MLQIQILMVVGGMGVTWAGAELLVRGASHIALALGVRPLVVGLTVVAFGTSSPEAVASLVATLDGSGTLAVGNVLGSNVANFGLILGVLAILHPIPVSWSDLRIDIRILLAATTLATLLCLLGSRITRLDGLVLLGAMGAVLFYYLRSGHEPPRSGIQGQPASPGQRLRAVRWPALQSLAGLVLLVGGAGLLVEGARALALRFEVDESVVGATVVAVGTSLPEFAASIVAVMRGHHEIGVGNIIGSNVFNLLFVLGLVGGAGGAEVDAKSRAVFLPAMILFTLVVLAIMRSQSQVARKEGIALLLGYVVFCVLSYY